MNETTKVYRDLREHGTEHGWPARAFPAQHALNYARAIVRGRELYRDGEYAGEHPVMMRWEHDHGFGVIARTEVQYDESGCDCWHDWKHHAEEGEPEPEPHYHFGIVGVVEVGGREVLEDACWGFYEAEHGPQSFLGDAWYAELATAWDHIGDMDEEAERILTGMPEWTREQVAAWNERGE